MKHKSNLCQSKTLFHAWAILVITLFINRLLVCVCLCWEGVEGLIYQIFLNWGGEDDIKLIVGGRETMNLKSSISSKGYCTRFFYQQAFFRLNVSLLLRPGFRILCSVSLVMITSDLLSWRAKLAYLIVTYFPIMVLKCIANEKSM